MLSEMQSKCGIRGRTEHHEQINDEREREPQGGEADRPEKRRKGGLTSTPRQWPSWEERGGWGNVTIISRGVEISIAGGGGEMVRGLSLGRFFSFFSSFFVIMHSLFLGTKSLMQC